MRAKTSPTFFLHLNPLIIKDKKVIFEKLGEGANGGGGRGVMERGEEGALKALRPTAYPVKP